MDILTCQALDERARAAPLDDKAILDELVNSLLDRNAADAVLLTHLALQRELFSCLIYPRLNLAAQFICDFLVFYHNSYSPNRLYLLYPYYITYVSFYQEKGIN